MGVIVVAYRDHLRSDASTLEINEVLRSSPRVLLGVESLAVETLQAMGVRSVFDLRLGQRGTVVVRAVVVAMPRL